MKEEEKEEEEEDEEDEEDQEEDQEEDEEDEEDEERAGGDGGGGGRGVCRKFRQRRFYFKAKAKPTSKTKPKTIHKTRRQAAGRRIS